MSATASRISLGVTYQRTKDITQDTVQRASRALSGNSTPAEVTDQNGFFGTWDARLRAEVNLHIAKLCAGQMGLSFGVAPNMGAVRFSDDPLLVNTDFQIVACIGPSTHHAVAKPLAAGTWLLG